VAPAQYALRVLLIGAANLGAIGYPGPFRAAITELAKQLNEAAVISQADTESAPGLLEEGGEMVVWGEEAENAISAGSRAFVEVYHDDMLDWGAMEGSSAQSAAEGRMELGPEARMKRKGGPTSTPPPLLVLCNNGKVRIGGNRESLVLCSTTTSPGELHLWGAIGTVAGMSVRTGCALEVDLAANLWRMLMGEVVAGGPPWTGRWNEANGLMTRLGLVPVAARGWVRGQSLSRDYPISAQSLATSVISVSSSHVLVDALSIDWGVDPSIPEYFSPSHPPLHSQTQTATLHPTLVSSIPRLTPQQACAIRWTAPVASALRTLAETDYPRAQTLLAGGATGPYPPAEWGAAGERRLEATLDDAVGK